MLPPMYLISSVFVTFLSSALAMPESYAALGDSFSAGIGSGRFLEEDGQGGGDRCARQDGSYPSRLADLMLGGGVSVDKFVSCSGDKLGNIGGQISFLNGATFDVVTLSISGNDFGFADIVEKCVYPWSITGQDAVAICNKALDDADALIDGDAVWDLYRTNVDIILSSVLTTTDSSRLYLTGYPRFFSPDGSSSDTCENFYFLPIFFVRDLPMRFAIRDRMNQLVLKVNEKIESEVVAPLDPHKIKFVNIDPVYAGHRFCEPGKDQKGADDPETYINDINSQLAETRPWNPPEGSNALADSWEAWYAQKPDGDDDSLVPGGNRGIRDKLQKSSTFHPKAPANYKVAVQLLWEIMIHAPDNSVVIGPNQFCQGLSPGGGDSCLDIPANCGVVKPLSNVIPTIACDGGSSPNGLFQ